MPWRDRAQPVRMERVALLVPAPALREVLVRVADTGLVELDKMGTVDAAATEAGRRLQRVAGGTQVTPALAAQPPDLAALESAGAADLLAGEAQLEERTAGAVPRGSVSGLTGWCPSQMVGSVVDRLAGTGGVLVPLRRPRGVDPPSLLRRDTAVRRSFAPLVETYATVPYADIDPSPVAGVVFVVMFGAMFGDAGHGLLLLLAGLLLRLSYPARFARFHAAWPFVVGAAVTAIFFGVLYGEFFGPTGVLPVLWLSPTEDPVQLLLAAVGFGAVLLAGAYVLGTVNRWREGGVRAALYAPSGLAGAAVFLGLGIAAAGLYSHRGTITVLGGSLAVAGLVFAGIGLFAAGGGGGAAAAQAGVGLVDMVIRLGANLVSFARLAAFGLTHAVIAKVVWDGTTALAGRGMGYLVLAGLLFAVGNALAFTLEALVAAVQALRLEYYELFSRVFDSSGRPFRPWHVPTVPEEDRK
ncbi:MAG TPA: V-type ATPase 116kDa subunit family protein [Propionibacteriaceae bacterium]